MGKIIAIANQKGGVGKTTTAINLGAGLAVAERKTLLIDLDPQGNASAGLGLDKSSFEKANIYHTVIGEMPIEKAIYQTDLSMLDICPSDNNLIGAEIELVSAFARESKLKAALDSVKSKYEYIIIDCPPSLGLLTVNAFNASDSYIVPLQTEYFAMEGLSQLLNTVRLIKGSLNPRIELEGILLTMYDARTSLSKQVATEIKKHFGDKVFKSIIPRNVKLSECPSFGKPVILYDINSKGSEAYLDLTKEVIINNSKKSIDQQKDLLSELGLF
ncbi:MAG: ParA family protein [Halobacteriovoraceae bacterium]|nr:ParA family protein [Halobacteriovoraceae bacterium]